MSISLLEASYTDIKSRKVPIKTWWWPVYIALPISLLLTSMQIWDGTINVMNPIHAFGVIYPLFIIGFVFMMTVWSTKHTIGGADVIAISIILLTSIPMGVEVGVVYVILLIILSIISIIITFSLKKWRDFKIPMIVPISFAYFIAIPLCLASGNNLFNWARAFIFI